MIMGFGRGTVSWLAVMMILAVVRAEDDDVLGRRLTVEYPQCPTQCDKRRVFNERLTDAGPTYLIKNPPNRGLKFCEYKVVDDEKDLLYMLKLLENAAEELGGYLGTGFGNFVDADFASVIKHDGSGLTLVLEEVSDFTVDPVIAKVLLDGLAVTETIDIRFGASVETTAEAAAADANHNASVFFHFVDSIKHAAIECEQNLFAINCDCPTPDPEFEAKLDDVCYVVVQNLPGEREVTEFAVVPQDNAGNCATSPAFHPPEEDFVDTDTCLGVGEPKTGYFLLITDWLADYAARVGCTVVMDDGPLPPGAEVVISRTNEPVPTVIVTAGDVVVEFTCNHENTRTAKDKRNELMDFIKLVNNVNLFVLAPAVNLPVVGGGIVKMGQQNCAPAVVKVVDDRSVNPEAEAQRVTETLTDGGYAVYVIGVDDITALGGRRLSTPHFSAFVVPEITKYPFTAAQLDAIRDLVQESGVTLVTFGDSNGNVIKFFNDLFGMSNFAVDISPAASDRVDDDCQRVDEFAAFQRLPAELPDYDEIVGLTFTGEFASTPCVFYKNTAPTVFVFPAMAGKVVYVGFDFNTRLDRNATRDWDEVLCAAIEL